MIIYIQPLTTHSHPHHYVNTQTCVYTHTLYRWHVQEWRPDAPGGSELAQRQAYKIRQELKRRHASKQRIFKLGYFKDTTRTHTRYHIKHTRTVRTNSHACERGSCHILIHLRVWAHTRTNAHTVHRHIIKQDWAGLVSARPPATAQHFLWKCQQYETWDTSPV